MKHLLAVVLIAGMSTCGYAAAPTSIANKSSELGNAMSAAFQAHRTLQPQQHSNDLEMVYGGEDIKTPSLVQTMRS